MLHQCAEDTAELHGIGCSMRATLQHEAEREVATVEGKYGSQGSQALGGGLV